MELAVKWLSLLHEPDAIIEIRSIDPKPLSAVIFVRTVRALLLNWQSIRIARFTSR